MNMYYYILRVHLKGITVTMRLACFWSNRPHRSQKDEHVNIVLNDDVYKYSDDSDHNSSQIRPDI